MYVCMYVCMHACMHIYIYIYTLLGKMYKQFLTFIEVLVTEIVCTFY